MKRNSMSIRAAIAASSATLGGELAGLDRSRRQRKAMVVRRTTIRRTRYRDPFNVPSVTFFRLRND